MARYKIVYGIGDDTLPEIQMIVDTDDLEASSRREFETMLTAGRGTWKIYSYLEQDRPLQTFEIQPQ